MKIAYAKTKTTEKSLDKRYFYAKTQGDYCNLVEELKLGDREFYFR